MHIREGYVYRRLTGEHVVIPVRANIADFNGIISLNETGAFLWQRLSAPCTREELADALVAEFEVGRDEALADLDAFLNVLRVRKVLADD